MELARFISAGAEIQLMAEWAGWVGGWWWRWQYERKCRRSKVDAGWWRAPTTETQRIRPTKRQRFQIELDSLDLEEGEEEEEEEDEEEDEEEEEVSWSIKFPVAFARQPIPFPFG